MTYSFGTEPVTPFDKGLVSDVASSPETARWFLVTGAIDRALRSDPALSMMLNGHSGEVLYMGISPSGTQIYTKTATGGGSSGGSTKYSVPVGARLVSYAEVQAALAPAAFAPAAQRTSAPASSSSKLPLYIGLGVGALALVGGGIYLMTRKPAPTPAALAANRRRARRLRRNGPADYEPRFVEDFGQEGSADDYQRAAAAAGRAALTRTRADRLRALADAEDVHDPRPRSARGWLEQQKGAQLRHLIARSGR